MPLNRSTQDPSLRLKNGSALDDAFEENQMMHLGKNRVGIDARCFREALTAEIAEKSR
jgi:hypothetical protein